VTHRGTGLAADFEMIPPSPNLGVYIKNNHPMGTALRVENNAAVNGFALDVDGGASITDGMVIQGFTQIGGNLLVSGTVTKGGGNFKIDHPLDPANKYLLHSFVESDVMLNVYCGDAATDSAGYATVALPEWFEALNRDFGYQLTIVDEADADEFVLAKVVRPVENNRFTIRTSRPETRVSWQVTGVRRDAFALANPLRVEQDKDESDRGRYLHPAAFGLPEEMSVGGARGRVTTAAGAGDRPTGE
jgi:hypothetical protein